mgnify:CR=1 FL=1
MKLIRTTDTLRRAQQMGSETASNQRDMIIELDRQGDQIQKSRNTVCCNRTPYVK